MVEAGLGALCFEAGLEVSLGECCWEESLTGLEEVLRGASLSALVDLIIASSFFFFTKAMMLICLTAEADEAEAAAAASSQPSPQ